MTVIEKNEIRAEIRFTYSVLIWNMLYEDYNKGEKHNKQF